MSRTIGCTQQSRRHIQRMPCWHETDARMCECGVWCYPLSTLPLCPRPHMLCLSHLTTQSVLWQRSVSVNMWQRCVRGGDKLLRHRDPVLDEDRLHGLAPPAARAGGCVYALQARVHDRAIGCAAGRAEGGVGGADADAATTHPVQACHALPDSDSRKAVAKVMKDTFNYWSISDHATECCLPASTVKLTPPTLDTCDGAYGRFAAFVM